MKRDLKLETTLLNDCLTILTATNGMQDCDANWDKLLNLVEADFTKHKGEHTEELALSVLSAVLNHVNHLTIPEKGQKGDQ